MAETPSSEAFPESELPRWLLRKATDAGRRMLWAMRAPPYKVLGRFAHDLRTCVRSGVDIVKGLELSLKPFRKTAFGPRWSGAVDQVRRGESLAGALRGADDLLPAFYLPVIEAGEQSGRLEEALEFLESHCKLLAGPASALRNVWFFPLMIMVAGTVIKIVVTLAMGAPGTAFGVLVGDLLGYLQLALIVAVVMFTPIRYFVDELRLSIPWLGALEREIAFHRFFRVLALLYSVSGQRVEVMIRTAAKTVTNNAARIDLLRAAKAIEEQASVEEAFRRVKNLSEDQKATIGVGELSGTLEKAFNRISDETGASMVAKLNLIQPFLVRIVMMVVMFSIAGTILSLVI